MSRAATRVKDRVNDDPGAAAIVAGALKRVEQKKGKALAAKKKAKRATGSRSIHGVDRDVHTENASSRQADGASTIDRDSDVPTQWKRPSNLDAPDARPGYVQRWVRYRAGNVEDTDNIEKAMDQGWRPVEKSTSKAGHELTARSQGSYGKYYVKRGLMLMEMPVRTAQQRNAFYARKLRVMTDSVERDLLRDNNTVMPVLSPEKKTRVTKAARRGTLDDNIPGDDD